MVTIAFYRANKRLFDKAVSWWTHGPYSHCELVVCESGTGVYRCASSSPRDGGVRVKDIWLSPEKWDLVYIDADLEPVAMWFFDRVGVKYDFLGLFGFIVRRGVQDKKKWFCSEAIAAALGYRNPWRLDPNTLYDILTVKR